ncbi:MAG: hypothetical protein HXY51_06240 [Nitrospirae bacterium]|nr:hypothetical protein [Nitrospirota bacterium]
MNQTPGVASMFELSEQNKREWASCLQQPNPSHGMTGGVLNAALYRFRLSLASFSAA